jgi:SAM-dependent methyltransferase
MAARTLADAFFLMGPRPYDLLYKRGAPWERQRARPELVELVESARISFEALDPGRVVDLGCGSGADALFLARHGFAVTGVDFSAVGVGKARVASRVTPPEMLPRFVVADLFDLPSPEMKGPFDLLIDGGTLDGFPPNVRPQLVERYTALARPGAVLVLSCSYGPVEQAPRFSISGPSRWGAPPIAPGEEERLFGETWSVERFVPQEELPGSACFLMTKR